MTTLLASLAVFAALVANAAHAGSLAPAPRVVAKVDRNFIERSRARTLEELPDTGIVRLTLDVQFRGTTVSPGFANEAAG